MQYLKGDKKYEGKAKVIYSVKDHEDLVWMDFKDSLTAFNAEKKGDFPAKGRVNNQISSLIFEYLKMKKIESHWQNTPEENVMIAKKVEIIPLEVVVRNILAGSTAKKLGIEEGRTLEQPLVEFYYKDDSLGDPFVSDDQILMMKAATKEDLEELKKKALNVNEALKELFLNLKIQLVDFKLEFGKTPSGEILLSDEITPDTCRLWDSETGEKMDKDRFRRDLGNVEDYYREVLNRIAKFMETVK